MKVSYNWIKEFLKTEISPEELGEKLTHAGIEVEASEDVRVDMIYDLGLTPNRPDWLSIRGIARELAAVLGLEIAGQKYSIDHEDGEAPSVKIDDPDLCHRYCSRIIRGVKPGPSPEWLSKRLEACGIRPMSNIVDVTNYVLLEMGQPLHAFDLERLEGGRIEVRRAGEHKKFTTLDGMQRTLQSDILMIWDASRPVAVAGVMGGQNTEVSDRTVDVLLESAWFLPSSIRRSSKMLGLSTESSYRFERGVDKESVRVALDRAASLIVQLAGGSVSHLTDIYPVPYQSRTFDVSVKKVSSLVGVEFTDDFVRDTLSSLQCGVRYEDEVLKVTPPGFRDDLRGEVDIAEDLARLYGYDRIPATLPVIHMSASASDSRRGLLRQIKYSLAGAGFSEVIHFSFLNPEILDRLNLSEDDARRNLVMIRNPLRQEESAMRSTLIPAMLGSVSLNLSRGEKNLRFFELSKVFFNTGGKLPEEKLQLSIAVQRDKGPGLWKDPRPAFFELKGAVERILDEIRIEDVSFSDEEVSSAPYLHPGKSCSVVIAGRNAGVMGALHPSVMEGFGLTGEVIVAELHDLAMLSELSFTRRSFRPVPRFPYVERDIALLIDKDCPVSSIKAEIESVGSDLVEFVRVFDIYEGKTLPDGKKSVAFEIRYRSAAKTLTDEEVEKVHSSVIKRVNQGLGAELR